MKKNLVMGVAKGYSWDMLEPFVASFEKNCRSAELVLFVDDISDFTRDRMFQAGVWQQNFLDEMKGGIPNNTRWKIFSDFIETHGDAYEQIFITDTRDVIFQSDIFAAFGSLKNYLGLTTEADDIGGSKTGNRVNYNWLVDCFGEEAADKLRDRKIICCGTVIGTTAEMKIFCRELWKILEYKTTDVFDQAVTNYLAYNNLLPIEKLIEIDVVSGEIFTNALVKDNRIRGDKILRGDGGIPSVVHQYDRHKNLVELVDRLYRDKNFQIETSFADIKSTMEQVGCLLYADKVKDATRLFLNKFFYSDDFKDCVYALIRIWELTAKKVFTPTCEILELAVQNALLSVGKFSAGQLVRIHRVLIQAEKNYHIVDFEFKKLFANRLLEIAEEYLRNNDFNNCFIALDFIDRLEMPADKNYYLFLAKANRTFGRKDEALEAYKKALSLS